MNEKCLLRRRFECPQPVKKLFSISVVAELFQGGNLGADGNNFRENAHRLGSALDDLATRTRRLESNKQNLIAWIGQPQEQVMQDASTCHHAAGRNNDAGISNLVDLP